jgi:prepilin-type N-terminal cleavage/methylation domain-containing protein
VKYHTKNQKGFTLIELTAVMVIIGVMASVGVKKLDLLSGTATNRALHEGVKELNIRESLNWTNIKLSPAGWVNDTEVFTAVDTDLGSDFVWSVAPDASGGTLTFRSETVVLNRVASTNSTIGSWQ